MAKFETEFRLLNQRQRAAVEATEGPVLVLAGPGTGKTQLLSMRVANILKKVDVAPSNILCLTFTDNAARNMRERLSQIIGQSAYHVAIHTFHSFGSDVINQNPDYFTDRQLLQPIDELGRYQQLHEIFDNLPHSNPLSVKVGTDFVFLKDVLSVIGWLKQNALKPKELRLILSANQQFIEATSLELAKSFSATPSAKQLPAYKKFLELTRQQIDGKNFFGFPEYAAQAATELELAVNLTDAKGRYAPAITQWRKNWCKKDNNGRYVYKDGGQNNHKLMAMANIYQLLNDAMSRQGLYDFDDMVIEAVHAVEQNNDLRYNLQERFQYVLVDEFQDTNKAQLRLLNALGDNPIHEGRPNLMAVGDDDQAIYAFQGAQASNMVQFVNKYSIKPITLTANYRSSANILSVSQSIAGQITDRLDLVVPDVDKQLVAQSNHVSKSSNHITLPSELAQYDWIADEVEKLIKSGTQPENIAVIAPRHKYLERLMPYLGARHIPVAYERRENILEAPVVVELLTMSALIVAIADNRQADVDQLLGQVLSYNFWNLPSATLAQLSLDCYNQHKHWLEVLINHKNIHLRQITAWFVELAKRSQLEPMEYMLDKLVGISEDGVDSEYDDLLLPKGKSDNFVSPLRSYYFSRHRYDTATDAYLTLLGQQTTLRHRLRQWKPNKTLLIRDLVEFANLHQSANLKIIDTNPHTQTTNAVQVMTAYKAKGLEFDAVFVINVQDEVWGPTARRRSLRISLPRNLPIEPANNSDNDRLRLLFVALTRAKQTLFLTSYSRTLDNQPSPPLSFILEENAGSLLSKNIDSPSTTKAVEILSTDWAYRFRQIIADKPTLLEPVLANYKLSVTHLNNFVDIRDGGPEYFLVHNLLRFPEALSPSAAYGDAVHKTLQSAHAELKHSGKLPLSRSLQAYFEDILARKHLRGTDHKRLVTRGDKALRRYFAQRGKDLLPRDIVERGFNNEGVIVAGANLSGKIDKLHFNGPGVVQVIDFKTGKPAPSWQGKDEHEKIKLHKYRQQLMFYKLLVENSASFSKQLVVASGALEFIEPNDQDKLVDNLELTFDANELAQFVQLIGAVWQHITQLNFPDTSGYPNNLAGIRQFERDLIEDKI